MTASASMWLLFAVVLLGCTSGAYGLAVRTSASRSRRDGVKTVPAAGIGAPSAASGTGHPDPAATSDDARAALVDGLLIHTAAIVYVTNAAGDYVVANPALHRAVNAPERSLLGRAQRLSVQPSAAADPASPAGGRRVVASVDGDGGRRSYEGTTFALGQGDDGSATGGVLWDVTERASALLAMTAARDEAVAALTGAQAAAEVPSGADGGSAVATSPTAANDETSAGATGPGRVPAGPVAAPSAPDAAGRARRLRILLAEDNPVNRRVAELMLGKLGHDVVTVGDGQAAISELMLHSYDVVVMDLQMPLVGGMAATRKIRAELPESSQPYIIAMTASVDSDELQACLDAGMDQCLSKPVRAHAFEAALTGLVPATDGAATRDAPSDPAHAGSSAENDSTGRGTMRPTGQPEADLPPAVDEAVLNELVAQLDSGQGGLRDVLLGSYLDEGATQVTRLLMAVTEGDVEVVAVVAHTLRSTSALLGATRLAGLLSSVEQSARSDPRAMAAIARTIEAEHRRVVASLHLLRGKDTVHAGD